jgi:hypothetical protein
MSLAKKLSNCVSAAVLTACFVSPVNAGPTNVSFTATANTTEYLVPTPNGPCPLAGMTTGYGTATYIGKISLTATDCVTPQPDGSFIFSNGKLVFTASNGDTVTATYGPGSFIALTPGSVYTINHAAFVIIDGTGVFKGAMGRGELHGSENIATIPATGQLQAIGVISFPNPNMNIKSGHQD